MTSFKQSLKFALNKLDGNTTDPVQMVRSLVAEALKQGDFAAEFDKMGTRVEELGNLVESFTAPPEK
jgi:hypothetical protein